MAKTSLTALMAATPDIDRARIAAATEAEIRAQAVADGDDPDAEAGGYLLVPRPQDLRRTLDLTQAAFASLLRVPIGTVRNWEQGRTPPDPAARTLLALVAADPDHARRVLEPCAGEKNVPRTGGSGPRNRHPEDVAVATVEPTAAA